MEFRYVPEAYKTEDTNLVALTLGWTHVLAPTTVGVVNLTLGAEEAKGGRLDGSKNYWGLRGTLQHSFSPVVGAFISAGHQWGGYSQFNTIYGKDEKSRDDRLADATLGLVWSMPDRWSVRPLVAYTRNWSNEEIYKYNRLDYSVSVRKDF